jgi:Tol biopolymer transport system component
MSYFDEPRSDNQTLTRSASEATSLAGASGFSRTSPAAEPQRLTHDGKRKLAPVFITDGDEVVFAVHESPNLVALKRRKLADGTEERLHPTVAAHQFDPAFSPDGRYHCFVMSSTSPQLVLVIQDTKGTESVFRPQDSRATARYPTIAPDGTRVVFSLSDVGGHQIASVNMQGLDLKRLTQSIGMNSWPAFSPDGRKIAFGSSRDGELDIYVMNADGGDVRRLTNSPGSDMRPAWSPDGKRIAFTSTRDGNYELYVMNADGSGQRNVTNHPGRDDFPAWHPDGRRLTLVSERDGGSDLYLIDVSS